MTSMDIHEWDIEDDEDIILPDPRFKPPKPNGTIPLFGNGPDHYPKPEYPKLPHIAMNNEWSYDDRRAMQEIISGVFLGPFGSAAKSALKKLQEVGVTHIVCVRSQVERKYVKPNFPDVFQYLTIECEDKPTENIIRHFQTVNHFINCALDNGGKVLIHGMSGSSRSAALLAGYFVNRFGKTARQARNYMHSRRFCIYISDAFMHQLQEYEAICKAQQLVGQLPPAQSCPFGSKKRAFSDEDEGMEHGNKAGTSGNMIASHSNASHEAMEEG